MVNKVSAFETINRIETEKLEIENKNNGKRNKDMKKISRKDLESLVEEKNKEIVDRKLEFKVHEKTGRILVKMIDRETDEVIREIPPEKFLNIVGDIWEYIGILVDERI